MSVMTMQESQVGGALAARIGFERVKIRAENTRAKWTFVGNFVTVLVGAGTLAYTIWNGQQQSTEAADRLRREVETQTLQSMISTAYAQQHGADISARLVSMAKILGNRLSPDIKASLLAVDTAGLQDFAESQRRRDDIIKLMATNPSKAHVIMTLWTVLFPEDKKITDDILRRWPTKVE